MPVYVSHRLNLLNRCLVGGVTVTLAVIFWNSFGPIFFPDDKLYVLVAEGEVATVDLPSASIGVRSVVTLIVGMPDLFWATALAALLGLSRLFGRGEVFSKTVALRLRWFGVAMLGASLTDPFVRPALSTYLASVGLIREDADPWIMFSLGSGLIPFVGACLVLLIAEIVGEAARIADEASLTI